MYHLRAHDSTPVNPKTLCGAPPEYYTIDDDEYLAKWAHIVGCHPEDMKPCSWPKLTSWEWYRTQHDMTNLCQECVKRAQPMGEVKINQLNQEIKKLSEEGEDDFIPF